MDYPCHFIFFLKLCYVRFKIQNLSFKIYEMIDIIKGSNLFLKLAFQQNAKQNHHMSIIKIYYYKISTNFWIFLTILEYIFLEIIIWTFAVSLLFIHCVLHLLRLFPALTIFVILDLSVFFNVLHDSFHYKLGP